MSAGSDDGRRRGPMARHRGAWARALGGIALMLVVYFVFPSGQHDDPLPLAAAGAIAVVAALGIAYLIGRQVVDVFVRGAESRLAPLAVLSAAAVVSFAAGFFLLERADPGQVPAIDTRLDSLYMAMVTLATIGYGDIHPEGQAARGLACAQIVFNLVVITLAVKTVSFALQERLRDRDAERRSGGPG